MIKLSQPFFGKEEALAVEETLDSGWVAGQGPKSAELSELVTSSLQCKYAIPVNNCTAGLHLALLALGIKEGDEVLVSDFTFPATAHAVLYCKAIPRFVDVELDSYNIDVRSLEQMINEKTKAIIVVHQFGLMANIDEIVALARKHNLNVIEDSACAYGARNRSGFAGTLGDIGVFSLHARKGITCGEGGLVVTNDDNLASTVRSLSCFGMESAFSREKAFSIPEFVHLGFNYKMSDINCAIAIEQVKKLPVLLPEKHRLVEYYHHFLEDEKFVHFPRHDAQENHVYQTFAVRLDERINRNELVLALKEVGIQSQIGTYSCHIQPVYNSADKCPNSLVLFNQLLALPLFYGLTKDDIAFIVANLKTCIQEQFENNE